MGSVRFLQVFLICAKRVFCKAQDSDRSSLNEGSFQFLQVESVVLSQRTRRSSDSLQRQAKKGKRK